MAKPGTDAATIGRLTTGAGLVAVAAGTAAWLTVRSQLDRERIVVPDGADFLPGRRVRGPLTAFAQAEAIRNTTLRATGGRTYGELGSDEPIAEMAMNASLLRSSLFTSVLAFGMSATQIALGGTLVAIGTALSRFSRQLRN
jgi:hypothetical protein